MVENLEHILVFCRSLDHARTNLGIFTQKFAILNPIIQPILSVYCHPNHPLFCQFLLDCSCLHDVLVLTQITGVATFVQGTVVQGDLCPRGQIFKGPVSKETLV